MHHRLNQKTARSSDKFHFISYAIKSKQVSLSQTGEIKFRQSQMYKSIPIAREHCSESKR